MTILIMTILIMTILIMTILIMLLLILTLPVMTTRTILQTCDINYNDITSNINKCNNTYIVLLAVIIKIIYM